MNILEVDVGNSRIKWRHTGEAESGFRGVAKLNAADEPELSEVFSQVNLKLAEAGLAPVRVRVSSVRGQEIDSCIERVISSCWKLTPEFARVSRECAGVRNSYPDVSRMGVDRWLAMLAAYTGFPGGVCVVDAGSALTVDLVEKDGRHLGGYIAPGLGMMMDSMTMRSSALRPGGKPDWSGTAPGRDTSSAMSRGVLSMTCGWLNQLHQEYRGFQWVFSGGDAPLIIPDIDFSAVHRPMLVMDGLSIVLP